MSHRNYISPSGEAYPSVTEILSDKPKPWLQAWKDKWGIWAERKTKAASQIGTEFHRYAESAALYRQFAIPETIRIGKMTMSFLHWVNSVELKIKDTELHVVSHKYKYAGTFDATGYLKAKPKTLVLFDWKTSSGIYPDMALQLSAYAEAYFEQTGVRIKRGMIVLVSKDKPNHQLTVKEYTLGPRLFKKFLKRLEAFNHYKKLNEEANSGC